jgi:O-antigen/teichoic acid export membrane protein
VLILGTAQFFVGQNGTVAAMLHAVGEVDGLSLLNIAGKLFWAVAVAAALLTGGGVQLVAFSFAASEGLKLITMHMLARRHLAVRMRIHPRRTCTVVVASLPFFVAGISQTLYSRVDTTMLSFLASDVEVGWYGAAATVSGMAMLLAPLLTWVLLPLSARAGARSDADVTLLVRRAMSLVIALALPVTLGIGLGADVIVHTLFGAAYAPATLSLQTMAPVFLFTYVGMVSGGTLIGLGRGWLVTTVMLGSLGLLPLLGWLLIPWGHTTLGAGGAGAGAAAALNITEACVAVALSVALGRRVVHRHGAVLLARNLAACVAVAALDRLVLASLGPARLIVDAAVYVALVVLWKAADYQELFVLAKRAFSRAKTPSTDETAESNGI